MNEQHLLMQAVREQGVLIGTCSCGEVIRSEGLKDLVRLMSLHAEGGDAE